MTTFTQNRHVEIARLFLNKSDHEFTAGDELTGAELLWGASAHAIIAVAQRYGWHYDSHGAMRRVIAQLVTLDRRPQWFSDFNTAENFHTHFYHGRLTDQQISADRPKVIRFVNRLLGLLVLQ